ncbi:MAG: MFS transporter [Saprospiraceae bacterium]
MSTLSVSAERPLYSNAFVLLCASHALFAASFNMLLPELPAYLTQLGGAEHKGLIVALFTITAGLSRPFSGKLADSIGRMPVMYIGTFACVVCSLLYPALAFVQGFLFLRFLHGFSTGFKPTGTAAYVADIVPGARRGEAMGWLGISFSVGSSAAPPLGSWLVQSTGVNTMFYTSSALALVSMLILFNMPETLHKPTPFHPRLLKVGRDEWYDPQAIPAAIVMLCLYFSYGCLLTIVPDLGDHLGVSNRGLFFTLFTVGSISTRLFAGRMSDRLGRVPVIRVSVWLIASAMALFACAQNTWGLYSASLVFGLGFGVLAPAITAWTVDLGDPARKGRALATLYIALELAIGGGAALSGWWYGNNLDNVPAIFWSAAALCMVGWAYLYGKKG